MNETSLPKYPESASLIRFEDCDPFGHLNNGRYTDYFLNAREDQLRENYNLDIYRHMQAAGKAWVVTSNQMAYLREAKLMEKVTIRTCLRWFTDTDIMMEALMLDKKTGKIKSVAWMRFSYIDVKIGKKTRHEDHLLELFGKVAILGEGKDLLMFEERVKELRQSEVAIEQ
ncbi:acyl-CoA thioesterase [Pontibacter sp. BT310]|uniref:Acyl-CoA thioesterase n=1 Tax=Pontibacter populi TaxID=890055 RepID=A0ABS6X691_9BACT|nr:MULTISPECIES: acyl-CoA thioesterase [Pontibacter]MBJ6116660.1 acyl-CoA thioesterase [Pontibacter sp. BT310]MBR0569084.1 acyl-CoA thioesterase [Microvirga sp. STS03]MBW3363514.1 acyl-CoA thioesterase [Pontibacter populi]